MCETLCLRAFFNFLQMKNQNEYSYSERNIIFSLLMMCSGILGAYAFIRTGVFCNAQTANIVLMGIEFGHGQWLQGAYYLIPFAAYMFGALISELLTLKLTDTGVFKWNTYLIFIEMMVLFAIGFIKLPESPDQSVSIKIVQISINFIASMQFTAFKRSQGIPMASTFCTNHIRQIGVSLAKALNDRNLEALRRGVIHFSLIVYFFVGAAALTLVSSLLGEKAIWLGIIPLAIVLALLIYGDLEMHKQHVRANQFPTV